jgi:ADP-ribosyl-[dinitrogen reductase] hydrolase
MDDLLLSNSRARGCLFGQIAGDNLGALVEFRDARSIAATYPDGPRLLANGGTWRILAGQATDDSEMALALARSCVQIGAYDDCAAADAYVAWGKSHPFDKGGTTAAALAALERGDAPSTGTSQANGALMRVSPLGILYAGNPVMAARAAEADARLTHPHPSCVAANRVYASTIALLVAGADVEAALDHAATMALNTRGGLPVQRALALAEAGVAPESYQSQMGWVLTAFQNAFMWLVRDASVEEAVVGTVRCGGDTDTNGAIVGALIGARDGVEAIPAQWVEAIEACKPGPDSMMPRPKTYWPNDAAALADSLLALSGWK